jgi:hypothetical protein
MVNGRDLVKHGAGFRRAYGISRNPKLDTQGGGWMDHGLRDYTDFQMLVFCIKSNFGEVGFSR